MHSVDFDVFSYRKNGTNRRRTMTLDALEFIRRFLQHVLPSGFQKVRHNGFLVPPSRISVEAVRWLVTLPNGQQFQLLAQSPAPTVTLKNMAPLPSHRAS